MKKLALILLLLTLVIGGMTFYARQEWRLVGNPAGIIVFPHGLGAQEISKLLEEKRVISNRYAALAYIVYSGNRNKLQAGEYMFDHPMTIPEVVRKLASGAVYLHKFTVPEGLTTTAIAQKWQEQGFGAQEEFIKAAEGAVDLVPRFDIKPVSGER